MDARKEGAPIIAIAGDVETSILDTFTLEELNPYKFFDTASLYTARVVNPEQARSVFNTAILTAILEKGPTVISLPGNIASMDVEVDSAEITIPATPLYAPCRRRSKSPCGNDRRCKNGNNLRGRWVQVCS